MTSSTFNYEYKLHESEFTLEGMSYTGYGISVLDRILKKEILCIKDITVSRAAMMTLIENCNKFCLSPTHIYDVIDDFLG